jgi:DNA (cytosine-5)-methyltransferase 1
VIALDLFAGTGWGVACKQLDIEEHGVEIMPEAIATREANGMCTIYQDVWQGLEGRHDVPEHDLLIASPPCQTFSVAGGGKGRRALDEVLGLIDSKAYRDVATLRAFGERHDPRTALVLTPLAHVYRDVPTFIVFEQVPPVLPVWERCAEEMRRWGYSVWTGLVNSEQYGVPQTRKRAILIARADGIEAAPPTPTHNKYNPRGVAKGRYADETLLPWVSMAEALEWGMTERSYVTIAAGASSGGTDPAYLGGSGARALVKAERDAGKWRLQSNYSTTPREGLSTPDGSKLPRGEREMHEPASTITSKLPRWYRGNQKPSGAEYQHRSTSEPAPTITGGSVKSSHWAYDRPATTIAGDSRVWSPGHKVNADDIARLGEDAARVKYGDRAGSDAIRITTEEAAALQSYPAGFKWVGGKGAIAQQIGNAVPPRMAKAILKEFL